MEGKRKDKGKSNRTGGVVDVQVLGGNGRNGGGMTPIPSHYRCRPDAQVDFVHVRSVYCVLNLCVYGKVVAAAGPKRPMEGKRTLRQPGQPV